MAYTVSSFKRSNVNDDVVFVTKNSRLIKSIYSLNAGTRKKIWQNKNFAKGGFGNRTFKINRLVTEKLLLQVSETTYVEENSQNLTKNLAQMR